MTDPKQQGFQHLAHSYSWISSWTPMIFSLKIGDLSSRPGEIKRLIGTRRHLIIWHELLKKPLYAKAAN
jgi:hypothetical protein